MGVRAIVLDGNNNVLLVRHTYEEGWRTPGGGVESGETPVHALARELKEEIGLGMSRTPSLFSVYKNTYMCYDDYAILYVVRDATISDAPNGEIAEVKWFPIDALPLGTTRQTKKRIAEYLQLEQISDTW